MTKPFPRNQLLLVLCATLLGLLFAGISTHDYVAHLDRQLHEVHCSFIPGLGSSAEAETGCRVAMNSAYSAVFRGVCWGGIPIALLGLGVYAFFAVFGLTLFVARQEGSRGAYDFLALASLGPFFVSVLMALISAVRLGTFCKTCVGLYATSILLAVGAIGSALTVRRGVDAAAALGPPGAVPERSVVRPVLAWLSLGALCVIVPVVCYVGALPDYRSRLTSCGSLSSPRDTGKVLLKLPTAHPIVPASMFVDPLCPTCKSLHERLQDEGALENLDLTLVLFPLDNACNWMVDRSLHPGACLLARAVMCGETRSREVLEWVFRNQPELSRLGKLGDTQLRNQLRERFGAELEMCADARKTKVRLNNVLQYVVANHVPVSTPQMYLRDRRICDEDTDLGLRYTLSQLAPEVLR
jgi:uncharacterized membrane protein